MDRACCRDRTARLGWYGLVLGVLAVLASCSGSMGGGSGLPPDHDAGAAWRLVREGDAASPQPELTGVTWGSGRFVAVALFHSILHSADGQTWHEADDRSGLYGLHDVVWGGNRFIAVGSTIGHSADGSRWQLVSDLGMPNLTAIAWNGIHYVAVGHDGLIMRSSDGDRWEPADSATTETLNDVTWNGMRFVAVGDHGVIIHSADGHRWTRVPEVVTTATLRDVTWGNDRFVAVGGNGTVIASP